LFANTNRQRGAASEGREITLISFGHKYGAPGNSTNFNIQAKVLFNSRRKREGGREGRGGREGARGSSREQEKKEHLEESEGFYFFFFK
jgi:hypothetical protein